MDFYHVEFAWAPQATFDDGDPLPAFLLVAVSGTASITVRSCSTRFLESCSREISGVDWHRDGDLLGRAVAGRQDGDRCRTSAVVVGRGVDRLGAVPQRICSGLMVC